MRTKNEFSMLDFSLLFYILDGVSSSFPIKLFQSPVVIIYMESVHVNILKTQEYFAHLPLWGF